MDFLLAQKVWTDNYSMIIDKTKFDIMHWYEVDYRPERIRLAECYSNAVVLKCTVGANLGFRMFYHGGLYSLFDTRFPVCDWTPELQDRLSSVEWRHELLRGRLVVGNFLHMDWILDQRYHRLALFSISNGQNDPDAWKSFMKGDGGFTFCYPYREAARAFSTTDMPHRVRIEVRDKMYTQSGSNVWVDHFASPVRIQSYAYDNGIRCGSYIYPDFLTMLNSNTNYKPIGMVGPVNPRDAYMNVWMYFSSMLPFGHPWPDQLNTQTWWVKTPSSTLREVFRQGPDDQKALRGIAYPYIDGCVAVSDGKGRWYGWLKEKRLGVDASGHAVNMLIMASYEVIDLPRYWDAVIANARASLKKGRKPHEYKKLVSLGRVTEDALHDPYRVWHGYYDYLAALYTYIIGAKTLKYAVNPWVVRITYKKLEELKRDVPETVNLRRKELDARISVLFEAHGGQTNV
jgi:hypothetical protein